MTLHHYRGTLLDNIYLENGYQRHETKWGLGTSYDDVEGLYRAVALELCLSNHFLSGTAVRFLRKLLQMTQSELGIELGCSDQSVAKWEKGDVPQVPVAAARLLRLLALKKLVPGMGIDHALTPYDEPTPERMVFSYSQAEGWRCATHVHQAIVSQAHLRPALPFTTAIQNKAGYLGIFPRSFAKLAFNDHKYSHESKLATA